jgi:hypothetical protein
MLRIVAANPQRLEALKANPLPELLRLSDEAKALTPWSGDALLYRIAVIVLGSLALIAAIGSIVLVIAGKQTPEVLVALGSAGVGALVGLFAPSPTGK